ncbi:MAG: hypothetical protein J6J60_07495 [Clostridia bacterium]|nr:hypothetical protein [Clostridia bacterium]
MLIPVDLIFNRVSCLLIVEVRIETTWRNVEGFLVAKGIGIIEKAGEFKGRALPTEFKIPKGNQRTMVQFAIVFPSEESLREFLEFFMDNE